MLGPHLRVSHYMLTLSSPTITPKGPSRTKNATTIAKISQLLRRSVFTTPARFTTPWTLLGEAKCL